MDPYFDANFFNWFSIFFTRLILLATGQATELYSDEIQFFVMGSFAVSASFLGVFLVLRRLTMMANALSHTMLLGIVLAYLFHGGGELGEGIVVIAALFIALLTSFLIQELSTVWCIQEDASNGIIFSALFALGVTLLSVWSRNAHAGPELLMGNPDALQAKDIPFVSIVALITLIFGWVFVRGFAASIFDQTFAWLSGFRPRLLLHLLLMQVALTTVSAFRAVGFVMTLAFFVMPPLIAQQLTRQLKPMLFASIGIGVSAVIVAIALSRHLFTVFFLPVSTGALAAVLLGFVYLVSIVTERCTKRVSLS